MNFLIRFLVGYAVITGMAIILAMQLFSGQFVPGVRQSVEDMLLQTANLLAEVAAREMQANPKNTAEIDALFQSYQPCLSGYRPTALPVVVTLPSEHFLWWPMGGLGRKPDKHGLNIEYGAHWR